MHLGGTVDRTYGEGLGAIEVTLTDAAASDPLLAGLPQTFSAFVGHKEACNGAPPGVTMLGTGEACPVQMYRHGDNVYVTQFHPELDVDALEQRMSIYRNAGYFPPRRLRHPDRYGPVVRGRASAPAAAQLRHHLRARLTAPSHRADKLPQNH